MLPPTRLLVALRLFPPAFPLALLFGDPVKLDFLGVIVRDERSRLEGAGEEFFEVLRFASLEPAGETPEPVRCLSRRLKILGDEIRYRGSLVGQAYVQVLGRLVRFRGGRRRHWAIKAGIPLNDSALASRLPGDNSF
jgi:hypothetical protein